uniref:Carbohydrate kinase FGGY N-terminal domain-containing protein n=1 Tax=Chromera velia CCMP2878 TaxID=1169474 RepID=A0A0G4I5S1_9ALVE|eukprot:Cvel_11178.t1-p1 / transcript=Cvel_11178.t1 / gene=Cvel_11178 / organism=Chromera_velia_CCMP2878 / gene_product=hypothetical protein / transcript_product=hypothetical protein / location=Cvel_scaffold694:8905-10077(+) / protein_length=297 / sequence_SO=supercontig / SO=protein_coding / is_pseudo=false
MTDWECAIDFGGSSTKWAIRLAGQPHFHAQGRVVEADHAELWQNPEKVAKNLVTLLVQHGATRIRSLGISVSGTVTYETDPKGCLVASDRMTELMSTAGHALPTPNFPLPALIQPRLLGGATVSICNDAVASAIGADSLVPPPETPFLVLTLGTFPAFAVVDRNQEGLIVYNVNDWGAQTIGTRGGPLCLWQALKAQALEGSEERRSQRVGRAISVLLEQYFLRFRWQPRTIVLMGGNSTNITEGNIQIGFQATNQAEGRNRPLPQLRIPSDYNEQSRAHLSGALRFTQENARIRLN